jgi:hypothetical protein
MPFVTASDVETLQSAIEQQSNDLDAAFDSLMSEGKIKEGEALADQWTAMRSRVLAYLATEASTIHAPAQMDAGQQLQRDLLPWYDELDARGANVHKPAPPPAPADLFGSMGSILGLVALIMVLRELK